MVSVSRTLDLSSNSGSGAEMRLNEQRWSELVLMWLLVSAIGIIGCGVCVLHKPTVQRIVHTTRACLWQKHGWRCFQREIDRFRKLPRDAVHVTQQSLRRCPRKKPIFCVGFPTFSYLGSLVSDWWAACFGSTLLHSSHFLSIFITRHELWSATGGWSRDSFCLRSFRFRDLSFLRIG